MITAPNEVERNLLDFLCAKIIADTWKIHLFKANVTPDANTVLGDVHGAGKEADFQDYLTDVLANPTVAITDGGKAVIRFDPVTWTMGTPGTTNNIYGHYITNSTDTDLFGVVRDPSAPIAMDTAGKKYTVFPVITLQDANDV